MVRLRSVRPRAISNEKADKAFIEEPSQYRIHEEQKIYEITIGEYPQRESIIFDKTHKRE